MLSKLSNPLKFGVPIDGVPDDEDLELINKTAAEPYSADTVSVFSAVAASNKISSYASKFTGKTLLNIVNGANAGKPIHTMHRRLNQNVGKTYAGFYDEVNQEARIAFFIPKGREIQGSFSTKLSTDDEIEDIRQGIRTDVSVGLGNGPGDGSFVSYYCSLCNKLLPESWEDCWDATGKFCEHTPGKKYDEGYAIVNIDNAGLVELSLCDTGAVPGAKIGSTQSDNVMSVANFSDITSGYFKLNSLLIPDYAVRIYSVSAARNDIARNYSHKEPKKMSDTQKTQNEDTINPLIEFANSVGIKTLDEFKDVISLSEIGKQAKTDLQAEAKKNSIAAFGPEDGVNHYASIDSAPYGVLKSLNSSFSEIVKAKFGGARQTDNSADDKDLGDGKGIDFTGSAKKFATMKGRK